MHNKFRHHILTFVRQIVKPLSVTQLNFVFVIKICSTSPLPRSKKVKNLMVRRSLAKMKHTKANYLALINEKNLNRGSRASTPGFAKCHYSIHCHKSNVLRHDI